MIQAKILQGQLRTMQDKGQSYSDAYHQGIGKLRAVCWLLENDKTPTLAFDNKELAAVDFLHGCF